MRRSACHDSGRGLSACLVALLGTTLAAGAGPRTWTVTDAHSDAITDVAFAPDGKSLATSSREGTAKLWDLAQGRARATLNVHPGRWVNAVAFSPDGSIVATGGGGGIPPAGEHPRLDFSGHLELWDVATAARRRTIRTPADGVLRITFSRDGRRIGTIDADRTARTWGVADGKMLTETKLPAGSGPAAFAPDLATLAGVGDDRSVLLIDVAAGREVARFAVAENRPQSLAFSPDGKALACGAGGASMGSGRGRPSGPSVVKVWDLSGAIPRERAPLKGLDFEVSAVAFSPDGSTIVAGGFGARAIAWDVATGERRATLQASCTQLAALAFAPDGKTLAASGLAPSITLWDTETWGPSTRLDGRAAARLAYLPDGKTLAVGFSNGTVSLRDLATDRTRLVLQSAPFTGFGVTALAVSRDGSRVAAGFERGGVALWDPASGALRGGFGYHHLGPVTALAFAPDGRIVASGGKEGAIRLGDTAQWREIAALRGHTLQVVGLAFSPDGKTLASAGSEGTIRLWDVDARRERLSAPVHTVRQQKTRSEETSIDGQTVTIGRAIPGEFEDRPIPLESMALSPDGSTLATGDGGYTSADQVSLRDAATGRERLAFAHAREPLAQTINVVALAFSPDGKSLASAGYETVQISDAATGAVRLTLRRPGFGPIRDLAFAPDGRSVAACGTQAVWIWDLP